MAKSATDYVGTVLPGPITLRRFVGSGKFAWVFEGRGPDGERCAVKMLYRDDDQAIRRFGREIKVMQELPPHPNCVAYRDHGETEEGGPWLAMEFIDGFTLQAVMNSRTRLPERTACTLMAQLCDGFHGFHKLGLTHRDITPDNIMITHKDREVKLMDFGLVQDSQGLLKLFESHDIVDGDDFADNLDAGLIAGTPEYMAPEQIIDPQLSDSTKERTDTTADVFALGVIFYELVCGGRLFPYEAGSRGAKGRQGFINFLSYRLGQKDREIPAPDDVSAELWSIIRKALAYDPKMRQRDASELGDDVRFYLDTGQGVLEDDMSQTIAQTVDLSKFRQSVLLTTGEFQSIQQAAASAEVPRPSQPLRVPAPRPEVTGEGVDTAVEARAPSRADVRLNRKLVKREVALVDHGASGRPGATTRRDGQAIRRPGGWKKPMLIGVGALAIVALGVALALALSGG